MIMRPIPLASEGSLPDAFLDDRQDSGLRVPPIQDVCVDHPSICFATQDVRLVAFLAVPQELLHSTKIITVFQQMRGKRVARVAAAVPSSSPVEGESCARAADSAYPNPSVGHARATIRFLGNAIGGALQILRHPDSARAGSSRACVPKIQDGPTLRGKRDSCSCSCSWRA